MVNWESELFWFVLLSVLGYINLYTAIVKWNYVKESGDRFTYSVSLFAVQICFGVAAIHLFRLFS